MMDLFSDEVRRNPYPVYEQLRRSSPVLRVPPPFDAWMIFDYDGVKQALSDHDAFSSRVPAPRGRCILARKKSSHVWVCAYLCRWTLTNTRLNSTPLSRGY